MTQSTLQHLALLLPEAAFVPEHSAVSALGFLAAAAGALGALLAATASLAARRRTWAAGIGLASVAGAVAYGAVLFGCSLASRDRVLAAGGRKYFCELDCHLAYSVAGVERARTVGLPAAAVAARGRFTIIRVRTWFDPSTIAPFRGNAPLTPNPRDAWLVDASGRRIFPSAAATRAFEEAAGSFSPFSRPLSPGQSYETALVFDLPTDARGLRLFVGDPPGVERLIIGHENSPGHGKTWFAIPA